MDINLNKYFSLFDLCYEKVRNKIENDLKIKGGGEDNIVELYKKGILKNSGICKNEIEYINKELNIKSNNNTFITENIKEYIKNKNDNYHGPGSDVVIYLPFRDLSPEIHWLK
jgi:hypothetical protein